MMQAGTRREFFGVSGAAAMMGAGMVSSLTTATRATAAEPSREPFRYCLNTATIRGQNVGIVAAVDIAAKAGYQGIEPWIDEIDTYVKNGGSLPDLRKRIADAGLTVESAIAFGSFLHEDPSERMKGLEECKRCMQLVRDVGGERIAAPPTGVTDKTGLDLNQLAERYRVVCGIGQQIGVRPMLELWGFSKTLARVGEVAYVGTEAAHSSGGFLLDIYHLHKGGSGFGGLNLLAGSAMQVFHVNDFPAQPSRESITDAHRVYPGDGVAPLSDVFRTLSHSGFRGTLSLELFNRDYWQQDAFQVAKTGLEKTKAAVARAFS